MLQVWSHWPLRRVLDNYFERTGLNRSAVLLRDCWAEEVDEGQSVADFRDRTDSTIYVHPFKEEAEEWLPIQQQQDRTPKRLPEEAEGSALKRRRADSRGDQPQPGLSPGVPLPGASPWRGTQPRPDLPLPVGQAPLQPPPPPPYFAAMQQDFVDKMQQRPSQQPQQLKQQPPGSQEQQQPKQEPKEEPPVQQEQQQQNQQQQQSSSSGADLPPRLTFGVRSTDGRTWHVAMRPNQHMNLLRRVCAAKLGLGETELKRIFMSFRHPVHRITDQDTPHSVGLREGDVVDVYVSP